MVYLVHFQLLQFQTKVHRNELQYNIILLQLIRCNKINFCVHIFLVSLYVSWVQIICHVIRPSMDGSRARYVLVEETAVDDSQRARSECGSHIKIYGKCYVACSIANTLYLA